ncbi:XkdX family protein [Caldanaerobius polysaccharolyticus]|nr:XkdX family protein [Caldanaerobius polysaccharolyticus]
MSVYFQFFKMCYVNGWITLELLQQALSKGLITQAEYDEIVAAKK